MARLPFSPIGSYVANTGTIRTGGSFAAVRDIGGGFINALWFEIGSADDSVKWEAIDAITDKINVLLPYGTTTTIASPVEFNNKITLWAHGATLIPNIPTTGGKGFIFNGDDQNVFGLTVDGATLTGTLTGNCYGIFGGDGVTKRKNQSYKNCKFINLDRFDSNTGTSNLIVTHGLYVDNVDNVEIMFNEFNEGSGAALFGRDIDSLTFEHNIIDNYVWYPVNLESGITNFTVRFNKFTHSKVNGIFWGGSINLVSQTGGSLCTDGEISFNDISGAHSYGSVIRIQSGTRVEIHHNHEHDLSLGTVLPGATQNLHGIRVTTRGISTATQSGPSQGIKIHSNELHAPLDVAAMTERIAIYCDNLWQTSRVPLKNLRIYDNKAFSVDATHYWEAGTSCHGQDGGIEELYVENNYLEVRTQAGSPVSGAVGFVGNSAQGKIDNVYQGGNTVIEMGTPSTSSNLGIGIGAYVDNVNQDKPNTIDNFYYGLRTFTNAGPTLKKLNNQTFKNILNRTILEGPVISEYDQSLRSATFTEIGAIGSFVNDQLTHYKYNGMAYRDSTNSRTLFSDGSNDNSTWAEADGTSVVTPS